MNLSQKKMALAAAGTLVVVIALGQVARTKLGSHSGDSTSSDDSGGRNHSRSTSLSGRGSGHFGSSNPADKNHQTKIGTIADNTKDKDKGSSVTGPAFADSATSGAIPGETEQQTRDRERYEQAQAHAFKYRQLDPKKIKPTELDPALQQATDKYQLPKDLLAAMMFVETGGTHRDGDHSMEAGYGVMNLRESNLVDTVAEGAALIGKSKEDVLYDQNLNIEAAAALLSKYHEDALAAGLSDSEAWYTAVSQYSGRPDPGLAAALADETAAMLLKGFEVHVSDGGGSLVVPPNPNPPFLPKDYKLVGMSPPTAGSGPMALPNTMPSSGQGAAQ